MKKLPLILILVFSCSVAWGDGKEPYIFKDSTETRDIVVDKDMVRFEIVGAGDDTGMEIFVGETLRDKIYKLQKEIELLKARVKELEKLTQISAGVFIDNSRFKYDKEREAWVHDGK